MDNLNLKYGIILIFGTFGSIFLIVGIYLFISRKSYGADAIIFGSVITTIALIILILLLVFKDKNILFKATEQKKETKMMKLPIYYQTHNYQCEKCKKEISDRRQIYDRRCYRCWKNRIIRQDIAVPIIIIIISFHFFLLNLIYLLITSTTNYFILVLLIGLMCLTIPPYTKLIVNSIRKLKKVFNKELR